MMLSGEFVNWDKSFDPLCALSLNTAQIRSKLKAVSTFKDGKSKEPDAFQLNSMGVSCEISCVIGFRKESIAKIISENDWGGMI